MASETTTQTECPSDAEFVEFVERRRQGPAAARFEQHIAECGACRAIVDELTTESWAARALTPDEMLNRGARVGRYRVLSLIGRGGMGEVYAAYDPEVDRRVALKLLHTAGSSTGGRRRLLREARALGKLSHPNVVQVYDVGEHEGDVFVAMELVEGQALDVWCRDVPPPGWRAVLAAYADAARGLSAAHEKGLIHRDVKPSNILRGTDGRVRVADFGLAAASASLAEEPASDPSTRAEPPTAGATLAVDTTWPVPSGWAGSHNEPLTATGAIMGTPLYMAPEQYDGQRASPASDQFSLCTALYEGLYGALPFGPSPAGGYRLVDVLAQKRAGPPAAPPADSPVPAWVHGVVARGLAPRPEDRYPSIPALVADIGDDPRPASMAPREPTFEPPRPIAPPADHDGEARQIAAPSRASRRRTRLAVLGAAAIVALGAAAIAVLGRDAPPTAGTPRRLTSAPGWEAEPAISPDGALVSYVSDEKGSADIWVVDVQGGAPRRLTDAGSEDHSPTWFPDGSALAFASDRGGQEGIWKVPSAGGAATRIVADAIDPAISPDGTRIAFVRPGAGGHALWVAPLADVAQAKALTSNAGTGTFWRSRHPAFSPDGATIAYHDWSNIWIVSAAGGPSRRLTEGNTGDGWPSWSPDGRRLYFSSMRDNTVALWRIPASGGPAARITLGTGPEVEPRVSRDGARLAYSTYVEERTLLLVDATTGTRGRLPDVVDFALAPDGSEVVYASRSQGNFDLWSQPLEGRAPRGDPRRLTDLPGTLACPAFSPDGRWIAFHRVVEGQRDVWILPAKGGRLEQITDDPASDTQPAWSPDGGFVAFVSNRSGKQQIWAAPVAEGRSAGAPRQVTFDDTIKVVPTWSPRGDEIAFVGNLGGENDLWVVPAAGGVPRRVTSGADVSYTRWDARSGELYASGSWGGRFTSLRRVSPGSGAAKPVDPDVSFGNVATGRFDVSRDGSTLAVRHEEARGDVWILDAPRGSSY